MKLLVILFLLKPETASHTTDSKEMTRSLYHDHLKIKTNYSFDI